MYLNTKQGFKSVIELYYTTVELPHNNAKAVLDMLKKDLSEYINNYEGEKDQEHLEKIKKIILLHQNLDTFDQELSELLPNLYDYSKTLK